PGPPPGPVRGNRGLCPRRVRRPPRRRVARPPVPSPGSTPMSRAAGLPVEELRAERDMLAYARDCLAAMRRRAESLRVLAGDPYAEEAAAWRLRQRVASLADDPHTALFFGRLDYDEDAGETPPARFYVGRRQVVAAGGHRVG